MQYRTVARIDLLLYVKRCLEERHRPMIGMNYLKFTLFNTKECQIQPTPTILAPTDAEENSLRDKAKAGVCKM